MTTRDERKREAAQTNVFDLTKRGYDPQQVDGHVQTLLTQVADAERGLRYEQGRSQHERSRAERAESELAGVRARVEALEAREERRGDDDSDDGHQGFGYRVEKLLRVAEQEAAEVRSTTSREATALLERAREDAEAHRHEVEQALIARTASVDQEATRRKVELDERERQIAEQNAASRDEAKRMLADVRRQAEQIKQDAQTDAEQQRAEVEKGIRERRVEAEQELTRLSELRTDVRGNLGRLLDSLSGEFRRSGGEQRPEPTEEQADAQVLQVDRDATQTFEKVTEAAPQTSQDHSSPIHSSPIHSSPIHSSPIQSSPIHSSADHSSADHRSADLDDEVDGHEQAG